MNEKRLSKSDFAKAIGVSRGRVTQLVAAGLPVADGKIPLNRGRRWYENSIRTGTKRGPKPKQSAPKVQTPTDASEALDIIRRAAAERLPELARRLGLPEHIAVAAPQLFDSLLSMLDVNPPPIDYEWEWEADLPAVPPEILEAANKYVDEVFQPECDRIFAEAALCDTERYHEYVEWALEEVKKNSAAGRAPKTGKRAKG